MKVLEINKNDLINNIEIIKKINNETIQNDNENKPVIIAVVKGNGMGLGLVEASKIFIENGINFLAVATVDEAIELRNNGINEKILMLSSVTDEEEIKSLIENDIIITIGSKESAERADKIAKQMNKVVSTHLKIDTGFGRYGFIYENTNEIIEVIKNITNLKIEGTFTHFSKSFDEKWTNIQFDRFLKVVEIIKNAGYNLGMLHVCNSTAFLNYSNMRLNAVRIGSAFQGRVISKNTYGLKKIGVLKSEVEEIKVLPKGYNVSYINKYKTKKETKIAVVPIGNMDGFNVVRDRACFTLKDNIIGILSECKKIFKDRRLSVNIKGKKYYIIGMLGMYHMIVDITGSDVDFGDEVIANISPILTNAKVRREYV